MAYKVGPSPFIQGIEYLNPFVGPRKPPTKPVSSEHLTDPQLFEPRTPCPVRYVSHGCSFSNPDLQRDLRWEHHTRQRESNLPRVDPGLLHARRRAQDAGAAAPAPRRKSQPASVFRQSANETRQQKLELELEEKARKARQERKEAAEQPLVTYAQLEPVEPIDFFNWRLREARQQKCEVEVDYMTMSESVQDQFLHNRCNRRRGRNADGNPTAWRPPRSGLTNAEAHAQHLGYRYSR